MILCLIIANQKLVYRCFSGDTLSPVVGYVAAHWWPKGLVSSQSMPASRVFSFAVLHVPWMTLHFAYWSLILRVITFLPLFWTQIVIYLHFLSLCIFTITVWKWNLVLPLLRHQHKNSVKEDKFALANIPLLCRTFWIYRYFPLYFSSILIRI